jgi:hypothetical protein
MVYLSDGRVTHTHTHTHIHTYTHTHTHTCRMGGALGLHGLEPAHGVIVVLEWCYSGVKKMSQWC